MYYEQHGAKTGVPFVLLHGGGSTIDVTFGRVLPFLARSHRIIAVEEQGHGRTATGARRFSSKHRRTTSRRCSSTCRSSKRTSSVSATVQASVFKRRYGTETGAQFDIRICHDEERRGTSRAVDVHRPGRLLHYAAAFERYCVPEGHARSRQAQS